MSRPATWTHTEMVKDLVRSRIGTGEAVVSEMGLGMFGSGGYVDVAALKISWSKPIMLGFEVKVSRADFLSDIRAEKWRRYIPFFDRFYFAAPAGMLSKSEIPEGAGLIVRSEKGWSTVSASKLPRMGDDARSHARLAFIMALHPGPWSEKGVTLAHRIKAELFIHGRREKRQLGRDAANASAQLAELGVSL